MNALTKTLCLSLGIGLHVSAAHAALSSDLVPKQLVSTNDEPVESGPFEPSWKSLEQYQVPEWFRDAKFGIWAHWGPQCEAEAGDWYARSIYQEGTAKAKIHREKYGHPSEAGFKDVIHAWKADKWDPERLVALYKRVGAQYFFAMANHHDNLDLWDSKYQPWNSTAVGPRKNIIAGWAAAARSNGLPFGISVHASRAWVWYERAQGADVNGPKAGVPYDGKLTKADGKGKWWDGLDPQDLYEQRHEPTPGFQKIESLGKYWDWGNGVSQPDLAYCQKFYNRTADLIKKYQPDLLYFDDTVLPLWPVSNAGLLLAADFYNTNLKKSGGKSMGVLFGKQLDEQQRKCLVWDIERGVPSTPLPQAWQTDTCIGSWHYNRDLYEKDRYKSAKTVVQMLADIVSKNGNLLLSIPVRGDGSIDEKEEKIMQDIASWMDVNKEAIFKTRPWKVFGEGPASEGAALREQGFNEGKGKPFTAQDVRFTVSKDGHTLYAIALDVPVEKLSIKSLGRQSGVTIRDIQQLGFGSKANWEQGEDALAIQPAEQKPANDMPVVYKITLR